MVNTAYLSALSALAGSAIGALASFMTTWLTQHYQSRSQRMAQEGSRREKLYGDFIDQAATLFGDALTHQLTDPSKIVPLYAVMGKLRLFASTNTIEQAQLVMDRIIQTYYSPNEDFKDASPAYHKSFDILRGFTEACRRDLGG